MSKENEQDRIVKMLVQYFWIVVLALALLGLTHLAIEWVRSSSIQHW